MPKKIVYIDMDNTVADFYKSARHEKDSHVEEYKMWNRHFFLDLEPIPGAQGAIFNLERMGFDVYILTQPLVGCPESYTDKVLWVQRYMPTLASKIVMTQNKGLNIGDYLIDDNAAEWKEKFERNGGTFIYYPYNKHTNYDLTEEGHIREWARIVEYFKGIDPNK
jgi:5'(3')-deoxyribonucleotidase